MKRVYRFQFTLVLFLLFALVVGLSFGLTPTPARASTPICVDPSNTPTCFATIQAAINASSGGDTISIAGGTYAETLSLVGKDNLAIDGAGQGATIIDASLSGGYGWDLRSSGITLSNFTFMGPTSGTYGIKVAGNSPTPATDFQIHDVTILNSKKTGLDINGVNGVIITNVTVTGTTNGNGISLTDVNNATLTNITTSGNGWGSIAIMTNGHYFPGGSDQISLNNITHTEVIFWELANFNDPANPYPVTHLTGSQLAYHVINVTDHPGQAFFAGSLSDATTLAQNATFFPHSAGSVIIDTATGNPIIVPGMSIQAAIDAAHAGDTLDLAAGTYVEQLTISKAITLQGDAENTTIIQSPDTLTACFSTKKPIICVNGADATITKLTVDGAGKGNSNNEFVGIAFYNAGGTVSQVKIEGIRETPLNGNQHGVGLYAKNADSASRTLTVSNNTILDYQKNGVALSGNNLTVAVMNNTVTGAGPLSIQAQNGIQVSYGASGRITGNTVSGNFWTGTYGGSNDPASDMAADGAAGILLYMSGAGVEIDHNTLTGNQFGIWSVAAQDVNIHDNTITGLAHTGNAYPTAIAISSADQWTVGLGGTETATSATITHNTISTNDYGVLVNDYVVGGVAPSVTVTGNTFSGNMTQATATGNSVFDTAAILSGNTFDKAVTVTHSGVPLSGMWGKIQPAIDAATAGDTVHVAAGTYRENLTIPISLILAGVDQATTIVEPAVSNPNCSGAGGGSLCAGASNVILVQANQVTIHDLTVDGDNPTLTSSITAGGADLDARNGIITNHALGIYNTLEVYNTTIKNIYLRGLYASSGGTFNFHNNTVSNVQADASSIAIFAWGGPGSIVNNTVSFANDAISANHSKGIQFLNNTVTHSASGVHTDNAGDGGGVADLIQGNSVSDCMANGYGVWDFVPYIAPTFNNNTVTNCAVGLSAWGQGAAVTTLFTNNTVSGPAKAVGSVGAYITTDMVSYGYSDSSASFSGNIITDNETGVFLDAGPQASDPSFVSKTVSAAFHANQIDGNTKGADKSSEGTVTDDLTQNWWGSSSGPTAPDNSLATGDPVVAGIHYSPWCASAACTTFYPPFPLTVTADDQIINEGEPDPTFTISYTGFVNPDNSDVLAVKPTCTVSVSHSAAGHYPIVCSGGSSTRYTFNYVSGILTVNAVNSAPVITEGTSVAVTMSENGSPLAFNLTLHASDVDAGDILTWSIATPASDGTASASGTGTSKTIGYSPVGSFSGPDSFVVQVSDGHGGTATITVNVTVNAVNNPPTDIALSSTSINENQPVGTTIGILSTGGSDAGNSFTYSLVTGGSGCTGADNTSFQISGSTLQTNAVFDYETRTNYSICIQTDDGHAGFFQKAFTITINNLVEPGTVTFTSTAAQDGWILESSELSNLGGWMNSKGRFFFLGDDAARRQYRAILSFNTSTLPVGATIQSVTLRIRSYGAVVGKKNLFSILGNLLVDIRTGAFGGSPALQLKDFNAPASANKVAIFNKTPQARWYTATFNAAGMSRINRTGLSQLRLRFAKDDNNDLVANYLRFLSGNAPSSGNRPQLIITYTLP